MTRFLLDLRSIYYVDGTSDGIETTAETGQATNIHFAENFVGNMGAPLAGKFGESDLYGDSEDSTLEFSSDPLSTGMLESLSRPEDSEETVGDPADPEMIEMVESRYNV